jgi:hypothetical protein
MTFTQRVQDRVVSILVKRRAREDNVPPLAHLTLGQMEERRPAAAALWRQGGSPKPRSPAGLGLAANVSRWAAATLAQEGQRDLEIRPIP